MKFCVVAPNRRGKMVTGALLGHRAEGIGEPVLVGVSKKNPTSQGAHGPLKHEKVGKTDYE